MNFRRVGYLRLKWCYGLSTAGRRVTCHDRDAGRRWTTRSPANVSVVMACRTLAPEMAGASELSRGLDPLGGSGELALTSDVPFDRRACVAVSLTAARGLLDFSRHPLCLVRHREPGGRDITPARRRSSTVPISASIFSTGVSCRPQRASFVRQSYRGVLRWCWRNAQSYSWARFPIACI